VHHVVVPSAVEPVVATVAFDVVSFAPAVDSVVAAFSADSVPAVATADEIVATATANVVISPESADHLCGTPPGENIVALCADDMGSGVVLHPWTFRGTFVIVEIITAADDDAAVAPVSVEVPKSSEVAISKIARMDTRILPSVALEQQTLWQADLLRR
jgi:hypothetical protein